MSLPRLLPINRHFDCIRKCQDPLYIGCKQGTQCSLLETAQQPAKPTAESSAAAILLELMAMEELKERMGEINVHASTDNFREWKRLDKDYNRRNPAAWAAAREWKLREGK